LLFAKSTQVREIVGDRGGTVLLHAAVGRQDIFAERGELRTAATASAGQRGDDRGTEVQVELFDELPSAAITHRHAATGRGDRARLPDAVEQIGFARAEHHLAEADAQLEIVWVAHGGSLDDALEALKPMRGEQSRERSGCV